LLKGNILLAQPFGGFSTAVAVFVGVHFHSHVD